MEVCTYSFTNRLRKNCVDIGIRSPIVIRWFHVNVIEPPAEISHQVCVCAGGSGEAQASEIVTARVLLHVSCMVAQGSSLCLLSRGELREDQYYVIIAGVRATR